MKGATTTFPYKKSESINFMSTKDTIAPTLLISLELRRGGFGRTKGFRTRPLLPSWSSSKAAGGRFHRSYLGIETTCVVFRSGFWGGFSPVRKRKGMVQKQRLFWGFIFRHVLKFPRPHFWGWNFPTKWLQFNKWSTNWWKTRTFIQNFLEKKWGASWTNFHGNFVTFSRSRTAALDLYHDDASLTSYAQGTHGGCFSNGLARDGALYSISGTTLRSMDAWVVER